MRDFSSEIIFKTARSGGKGGQHVNKVETKAEAWWAVAASAVFTDEEKARICQKLEKRISKSGFLVVKSEETRSQQENKQIAARNMLALVNAAVRLPRKRKPTRPSKAVVARRAETKQRHSEKKQQRKKDF